MKARLLCVIFLLIGGLTLRAQDISTVFQGKTSYETDKVMLKVIVCAEDQSVWALSDEGKVYYKSAGTTTFLPFPSANALNVTDLTGYNANEMYFLTATNQLFYAKNKGDLVEVPVSGGRPINGIAVVYASRNVYLEGYHGKRDWLAVATQSVVHSLFRDNGEFGLDFTPVSTGSTPDCRITNSGYKSLDFQYSVVPSKTCYAGVTRAYYHKVGSVTTETALPEASPVYDGKVNCTYFEAPFNKDKDGGKSGFDYWGTDKGLFVKPAGSCNLDDVSKLLNVKINDLEELNFFREIFNTKMILAAAADGLYFGTNNSTNPQVGQVAGKFEMAKIAMVDVGVNGIATEIHGFNGIVNGEREGLCETAVWLATTKGVIRLSVIPAAVSVDKNTFGRYGPLVSVDAGLREYYCVSNGEEYRFSANLPNTDAVNYTVQWLWHRQNYADRTELPGTRGTVTQTFRSGGEYGLRITSACGERVDIGSFWLRDPEPVTVDFNYPPVVTILSGCSYTFHAKAGNVYQWEKDGQVIDGESSNTFVAKEPGVYQLSYLDYCTSGYAPVAQVEVKAVDFPEARIIRSGTGSLCFGEKVTLRAKDPGMEGITYRWSRNGINIPGATSSAYEVSQPGNYYVDLVGDSPDCFKRSATEVVDVNEEIRLEVPPQVQICTMTGQQLKLTAPEGFAKYTWDGMPGTDNFLNISAPGEYQLVVEDAAGCTASSTYIVVAYCPPPIPPNSFSPNGDGTNDTWTVKELIDDPAATLRIFNRFGNLVFTGSHRKPAWDGRFNGTDCPVGTYYYVVTQKIPAKAVTGSLTLIR